MLVGLEEELCMTVAHIDMDMCVHFFNVHVRLGLGFMFCVFV